MRALDEATLQQHLGRFISVYQIRGILARRDKIEDLAKRLAAEQGEAAVYYP